MTFSELCCKLLKIVLGIGLLLALVFIAVITLPFCLYRLIVCYVIAPTFRKDPGKCLTLEGQALAFELGCESKRSTRCSIVTHFVCPGTFPFETIENCLKERWIYAEDSKTGQIKYPEFQQYIENFMGYLFWTQDKRFKLENHLIFHEIDENGTVDDAERFLVNLAETLVNKPFPKKRSPWEFHVVHNYKNQDILKRTNEDRLTLFIFRCHHGMADGFSVMNMLGEKLLKTPFSQLNSAIASSMTKSQMTTSVSIWERITTCSKIFSRLINDLGCLALINFEPSSPWRISDKKKKWKQVYSRSNMIPLQKIKSVKNKLEVSFNAVIHSAISHGISKHFQIEGENFERNILPFAIALPLPQHPDGLRNKATGTILNLPLGNFPDPIQRLLKVEENVKEGKSSVISLLSPIFQRLFSCHIAPVLRMFFWNNFVSTGLSNFPGPGMEQVFEGRKILTSHFCAGALEGVGGVGFYVLSYYDHIWITALAEEGIMSREKLDRLVGWICEEIDNLSALTH